MKQDGKAYNNLLRRLNEITDFDPRRPLTEITFLGGTFEADENPGDDEQGGAPAGPDAGGAPDMGGAPMGGDAPMGPDAGGAPDMGGGPMGGPDMGGGPMGPDAGGMDPNAGGAPGQDAGAPPAPPQGFNPQDMGGGAPMGPDAGGADMQQPGDEVLDVTELTDKQDDIKDEVEGIGGKFEEVMKAIGAFEELLRSNDEKIEDLKAEFERRNPTQIEKLGVKQAQSYPFNVSPNDYWKDKEATSNYSAEPDNNGKEQGQYVITADDVKGDVNWKAIADSFNDDKFKTFMYEQTLDKLVQLR